MAASRLAVVLAENIYECLELQYPRLRLVEAGYDVRVVAPKKGETYTSKEGYAVVSDATFDEIDPSKVRVLIIPGGYCPDKLRRYEACNTFVRQAAEAGAVIGFICHGGWVPISAGILKGVKATAFMAIKDDMVNAGVVWSDEPCVVDGKIVSAQVPKDLPAFMQAILKVDAQ